jgi:voltage-gated potassium channel
VVIYVTGSALVLILCAALAGLNAERGHDGANINSFGDAIWWAFVTVCTVGYGDHFPVTIEGRFVAVGLMIGGIALIGVVTATFASWLIDRVRDVEETNETNETAELRTDIQQLRAEIAALHQAIVGSAAARSNEPE